MISSKLGFPVQLYSSFRGVQSIGRVLGYVLSFSNMAAVKVKKNFNRKHLKKGDPLPPFTKLRVFNMRFCPFAHRTILTLIAKDLDFEVVNVDLVDKPEWLIRKSTTGKVPAIEILEGMSIYESLATVAHLDGMHPQRPLRSKDPVLKAKDDIIVKAIENVHTLFFKLVKAPEIINEQDIAAYFKSLDLIQYELEQRGTKFLGGDEPGYADYMIWPWFEKLISVDYDLTKLDEQKYKLLLAYIDNMLQDPVVLEYIIPKEKMKEFLKSYTSGPKPNYDLLLEN